MTVRRSTPGVRLLSHPPVITEVRIDPALLGGTLGSALASLAEFRPPAETAWHEQALCSEIGGDWLWFPEDGVPSTTAKRVCSTCPVRADCLAWALAQREPFGIWAGTTVAERRRIWMQEDEMEIAA